MPHPMSTLQLARPEDSSLPSTRALRLELRSKAQAEGLSLPAGRQGLTLRSGRLSLPSVPKVAGSLPWR